MVLQVVLLMWLRTVVNYQYKHGVDGPTAFRRLYAEGGIPRFYRGATLALLTGPVARFGDTASNEGVRELFGGANGGKVPVWAATLAASVAAALWRVAITPLDTLKTTLQVVGPGDGIALLRKKTAGHGVRVLWDGALGNSLATLAGHYPWFVVHNFLDARLPLPAGDENKDNGEDSGSGDRVKLLLLLRRAWIGFCSSVVSDCVSNGIRVVKTYQQTSPVPLSYAEAFGELLSAGDGPAFLFRGLRLKILSNGLSGILFAVLWKTIRERLGGRGRDSNRQQPKQQPQPKTGDSKPKRS